MSAGQRHFRELHARSVCVMLAIYHIGCLGKRNQLWPFFAIFRKLIMCNMCTAQIKVVPLGFAPKRVRYFCSSCSNHLSIERRCILALLVAGSVLRWRAAPVCDASNRWCPKMPRLCQGREGTFCEFGSRSGRSQVGSGHIQCVFCSPERLAASLQTKVGRSPLRCQLQSIFIRSHALYDRAISEIPVEHRETFVVMSFCKHAPPFLSYCINAWRAGSCCASDSSAWASAERASVSARKLRYTSNSRWQRWHADTRQSTTH